MVEERGTATPDNALPILLQATVHRYSLFAPGQAVVVAVSGGPDSAALLHSLWQMQEEWNLHLTAAHLHHGIRGAEADGDADYVQQLCDRLDVPCVVERADVPALRQQEHRSIQETARDVRHDFLRRVATNVGAERIALGHTRDDRVETILLNLLRGTGLDGLGGFPAANFPLVRPLYDVARAQTLAYCEQHQLAPRFDSSNAKTDYARNRVRAELLPYLATYYNQRVDDALLRMAELSSADNDVLEQIAAQHLTEVVRKQSPTAWTLDGARLRALHPALQRRIVRQAIAHVRGHLHGVDFQAVEQTLTSLRADERTGRELPSQRMGPEAEPVRLRTGLGALYVERVFASPVPAVWNVPLSIPGETLLPTGDTLRTRVCAAGNWYTEPLANNTVAVFDFAVMAVPLQARAWKTGDRMRVAGLNGSKKLQDIFTDARISTTARAHFPVLTDAHERILAVMGLRRSEYAWKRGEGELPDGRNVLIVEWRRAGG